MESGKNLKQPKLAFNEANKTLSKDVDSAVIDFIAEMGIAFRVIGTNSFRKLMGIANKNITLKDPRTYLRLAESQAKQIQEDIKAILKAVKPEVTGLACTTDM